MYTDLNSAFDASLHLNRNFQIVHTSFNYNIIYSQPYHCLIWDCKTEDISDIRKSLDLINWEKLFSQKK